MLHFAYGSNMAIAMMQQRCPGARLQGPAILPGYRFMIMRTGYATVVPARGGRVYGVLWRIGPRDVAALNAYEGIDWGLYRPVTLPVIAERRHCRALVYIGSSRVRGRPRSGYMELVLAAAHEVALPPDYVRNLGRHRFDGARRDGE